MKRIGGEGGEKRITERGWIRRKRQQKKRGESKEFSSSTLIFPIPFQRTLTLFEFIKMCLNL